MSLKSNEWQVAVLERDLPCSGIHDLPSVDVGLRMRVVT